MSDLDNRITDLEERFIPYYMECIDDTEENGDNGIALSIYYGYYNQFLEFYDHSGNLVSREPCNYNEFS